jgi:hypothetical protein
MGNIGPGPTAQTIAKNAPHWAALLLLVLAFLLYMDRKDTQNDLVAEQRIESCHSIQRQTTDVLRELVKATKDAATADAMLNQQMSNHRDDLEAHANSLTALERALLRELEFLKEWMNQERDRKKNKP